MMLDFDSLLQNGNLRAFLRVVRAGESDQTDDAYRMLVGGAIIAGDLSEHPRIAVRTKYGWSSAFGAYQIMAAVPGKVTTDTYDWLARELGPGMTPGEQDRKAIRLIAHRGALVDVIEGNFQDAVRKCAREWASLPDSPYGQPVRTLAQALETYASYGGDISEATA